MKLKLPTLAAMIILSMMSACAQQAAVKEPLQSVVPESPRFSIVQSPIAARETFKLDSYTGIVYQLVVNADKKELWQMLRRTLTSYEDTHYPDRCNYKLFLSTLGVKFTYLINVNTGAT